MSLWSDLPNAQHIDRVFASLKEHQEIWSAAFDPAWLAAWLRAYKATWFGALDAAYDAALDAVWSATRDAAWYAARAAILALVVYDDCAHYLDMPSEQLRMWATLTEEPAAVLLLPAVIAFERIGQLAET